MYNKIILSITEVQSRVGHTPPPIPHTQHDYNQIITSYSYSHKCAELVSDSEIR